MVLTKDSVNKKYITRCGDVATITDYCEDCPIYAHAGYIEYERVRYKNGKWEKYTYKKGMNWERNGRESQYGGELNNDIVNAL